MTSTTRNRDELVEVWPVRITSHEGASVSYPQQTPCAADDLEVRNLSDHEWRVGDRRCHEKSPAKVLGYIEKCASTFEVLNLEDPRQVFIFDRFEAAVASFASAVST
jgi:hypothetical protein